MHAEGVIPPHSLQYRTHNTQHTIQIDLAFVRHPALRPLPRAVYALLRSPLLSSAAQGHADLTTYLHQLWLTGLPAKELARAIYPELSAWGDPNKLISSGLDLSKASLDALGGGGGGKGATIFVLDAYILILVLYRGPGGGGGGGQAAGEGWQPPADSLLWQSVTRTRQVRRRRRQGVGASAAWP